MKKITLAVFLVLFAMSCAPLMEETWTVTTPEGPVTVRHYDPVRELLFGFYCASLINPSQTQYYYPPISPYLSGYSYCPPDIWADWTPLQRSLWIEWGRESELRDYEYKLQSINDMETWKLKMEVQGVIDDLENKIERAKDELKSKADLSWLSQIPPKKSVEQNKIIPPPPGFILDEEEKKKGADSDFSFLDAWRPPKSEDQVEVIQWFGPSAGKKFVSVGIDYAKKAQGLVFSVEVLMPGDVEVVYGMRWPPKRASDGGQVFEQKEISKTTENGLANAIKEIIDDLWER